MSAQSLESALRTVEPAVRLVSERHLRIVLHALRDRDRPIPANPDVPFWVTRDELWLADAFPVTFLPDGPERFLLLTEPDDRLLDHLPFDQQLGLYWRLLFQAAVLAAIDARLADGTLTVAGCASRLARLGLAAEREVRYVLETDHLIDPRADAAGLYRMFAAVYLDLKAFAPDAQEDFFPSLPPPAAVLGVLGADVDSPALLARTRPPGAPDPDPGPSPDEHWLAPPATGSALRDIPVHERDPRGLLARALDAEQKGNLVRAAILSTQAATASKGEARRRAIAAARAALQRLVEQLGGILDWDGPMRGEWRQAIDPLLPLAANGIWPRAARCLYELQTIATDLSGEVYAVDLIEPIRTLGRRPVKRPLPHAPAVIRLMHLRAAHKQLLRAGLGEQARVRLDTLLHHEIHHTEHDIRHTLTPIVTAALLESGFRPANYVEEVARDKAVAELLDRVCERGYLRIGDLRDAVARNQLKMPDLSGPGEFLSGDPLLRADTRLAYDLDGIYRRGEVYLRALQRGSSVFFGTRAGRFLTLYAIGPFLAAFLTLMFLEELRHLGEKGFAFVARRLGPPPAPAPEVGATGEAPTHDQTPEIDPVTGHVIWTDPAVSDIALSVATASTPAAAEEHHASILVAWPTVVGFGVFLLLVFHVPPFRRLLVGALRVVGRTLRVVVWDIPGRLWRSPLLTALRHSAVARFVNRHLRAPLVLSAVVLLILFLLGVSPRLLMRSGWAIPAVLVLAYNTPWGWVIQDRIAGAIADWWRVIRVNLIPGLIAGILDAFRAVSNWIERRLYAVDEWLRFRGGDSQGSLAMKAVIGLVWFPFAYVTRFAFYLLLEPQINPVKHFPVVTVSHKVILPLTPSLADAMNVSEATAAGILGCIPGIFGFIAWELMANWRLYRANRPDRLKPVMIGSHGETMRGLLRPGFHSGTVPKLYRRLRKADRRGEDAPSARYHYELAHVAEAVERFVDRELVRLLEGSSRWGGLRAEVTGVRFGCQRLVVEIAVPDLGPGVCALSFENCGGQIETGIELAKWADRLKADQRAAFLVAVRGLADMAGAKRLDGCPSDLDLPAEKGGGLAKPAWGFTWSGWVHAWEPANYHHRQ